MVERYPPTLLASSEGLSTQSPTQEDVPLTKQDFIQKVAQKSGLSARDAGKAVDAFMETVTETLKGGDAVNFTGFGKFSASQRAARQGVNPRTGERVQIAATTVPKFSAGSQLKAALKS
jgi:nucleoid DNA-binding protein